MRTVIPRSYEVLRLAGTEHKQAKRRDENVHLQHDSAGNLLTVTYANYPSVTFTYDALNRCTNMVDGIGTTRYTYTAAGQLLTEDGPFPSDTVTYSYANRLRIGLSLQQPSGQWTNGFGYDAIKRLSSVKSPAGESDYRYPAGLPSHLLARLSLPNGAFVTNTYDGNARLTGTYLKNSGGTVLDSYAYTYNTASQRTGLTRADSSSVGYSYDPIGQLTVANDSASPGNIGYAYDAAWNLSRRTNYFGSGSEQDFTNNSLNELTGPPGETATYDANGNLTQRDEFGDVLFTYAYDDENRLVSMEYDDFGTPYYQLNQLVYDGLGRLRQAGEYAWDDTLQAWVLSDAKNYIYDGWRVIQERDGNNSPLVSYTRGSDLSGSLEGAGGIGGLLARSSGYSGSAWTTNAFYFADGNGNITYMTDGSQAMVAQYRYDPYGTPMSESGSLAYDNSYRFSSKELLGKNIETYGALYYYGFRFYDPYLQRWLTRDPMEEQGGFNLYCFVSSDPIAAIDPVGLDAGPTETHPPTFGGKPFQTGKDNCLSYALDCPGGAKQPDGGSGGGNGKDCKRLLSQISNHYGGTTVPKSGKCPGGSHKIAVFSDGGGAYHVQRQNGDGSWSEMSLGWGPGQTYPPRQCKRGGNAPGKDDCGDLCVPDQP